MDNKTLDPTILKDFKMTSGTSYKYRDLTPMEAIPFCTKVAKLLGPFMSNGVTVGDAIGKAIASVDSEELTKIMRFALGRCYNEKSESLENEAVFNKWFSNHPDELLEAGGRAIYNLAIPFIPSSLNIPNFEKN